MISRCCILLHSIRRLLLHSIRRLLLRRNCDQESSLAAPTLSKITSPTKAIAFVFAIFFGKTSIWSPKNTIDIYIYIYIAAPLAPISIFNSRLIKTQSEDLNYWLLIQKWSIDTSLALMQWQFPVESKGSSMNLDEAGARTQMIAH